MIIQNAAFVDFRNIESGAVDFSPSVNVLWGDNAQGKSNILEGVYYFARCRSFRGAHDRDMVRVGADAAAMRVTLSREDKKEPLTLDAELPRSPMMKKKLSRNGAPFSSVGEMIGNLRAVLFCPAHLSVVTGGPAERRSFFDVAISQIDPGYIRDLYLFKSALANRGALIKRFSAASAVSPEEWEVWAERIADPASRIVAARLKYSEMLGRFVSSFFSEMTDGREKPALNYKSHLLPDDPDAPYSPEEGRAALRFLLTSNIEREAAAGATLWGPHKDDLRLTLDGGDVRLFASQGQQRSFALAMKLSEGEISREVTGEYPVFLLDDVFSELDASRRRYIMDRMTGRQIIVTSCEPSVVPGDVAGARFLRVEGGRITEVRD